MAFWSNNFISCSMVPDCFAQDGYGPFTPKSAAELAKWAEHPSPNTPRLELEVASGPFPDFLVEWDSMHVFVQQNSPASSKLLGSLKKPHLFQVAHEMQGSKIFLGGIPTNREHNVARWMAVADSEFALLETMSLSGQGGPKFLETDLFFQSAREMLDFNERGTTLKQLVPTCFRSIHPVCPPAFSFNYELYFAEDLLPSLPDLVPSSLNCEVTIGRKRKPKADHFVMHRHPFEAL